VDRKAAARYQINVADVRDAIKTAVGGNAFTQVLDGERRYDLVLRYPPQLRDTKEAIENIRLLSPSGERVSIAQLCKVKNETAVPKFTARRTSGMSPSNIACGAATWAARSGKPK
jgi:Cu/Ag efflux pump CusA